MKQFGPRRLQFESTGARWRNTQLRSWGTHRACGGSNADIFPHTEGSRDPSVAQAQDGARQAEKKKREDEEKG